MIALRMAETILRHSDSSVTRRRYLVLKSQHEGRKAMRRIERAISFCGTKRDKKEAGSAPIAPTSMNIDNYGADDQS
jgi:hypothetical protein